MNQQIAEEVPLLISRVDANQLIPSIESAYIGLQIQDYFIDHNIKLFIEAIDEQTRKIKSLDITQGKKRKSQKDKKNDIKLEKWLQFKNELDKKIERKNNRKFGPKKKLTK